MAYGGKEASVDFRDPHERHRERQRLLEQRVAETLALKPSKPCPLLKGNDYRVYKLTPDEEEREIQDYQRKSRQVRILQVRAQEWLLAAQRVEEFRQRKKNEKQKLLQVLKEAWQEEQKKRLADVEDSYRRSCKGIGGSHEAAQEVVKIMAAIAEEKAKQAEENRLWETLRFQKAMHEESARKLEAKVDVDMAAAKDRRRVAECAAEIERTRARTSASRAKSRPVDESRTASVGGSQKYMHPTFDSDDIKRTFVQSRLGGAPEDYKDTYFHSRFCVLKDRTNLKSAQGDGAPDLQADAELDAWEAAEAHMKSVEIEKKRKAELKKLWHKRKVERGLEAAAHLQVQKIASLEEELAFELVEEHERKRQLQLIEDLSRAAHTSAYKSDHPRRHLDPKPLAMKGDIEADCAGKPEETCTLNMARDAGTAHQPTGAAMPLESLPATPKRVPPVEETPAKEPHSNSVTALGAGIPSSSQNVQAEVDKKGPPPVDELPNQKIVDNNDTAIIEVRHGQPEVAPRRPSKPSTPTEPSTPPRRIPNVSTEEKVNPQPSPPPAKTGQLRKKAGAKTDRRARVNNDALPVAASNKADSRLPGCTPNVQSVHAPTRGFKGARPTATVSSNLNLTNNIRKGNKSPQRLDSPGRVVAPNGCEKQGTAVNQTPKDIRSRSRGRQSIAGPVDEVLREKPALPIPPTRKMVDPTETPKSSPRRRTGTGTWLSNVLEKLTWWKSQKELPLSGLLPAQDKPDPQGLPSSTGQQPARNHHREKRKEDTPKFSGKQIDFHSSKPPPTSSNRCEVTGRPKLSESANLSVQTADSAPQPAAKRRSAADEPGWYEACTKDVFSPEELEELRLELYGTWTDAAASAGRNNNRAAKARKENNKPRGQQDDDSENLFTQRDQNMRSHVVLSGSKLQKAPCSSKGKEDEQPPPHDGGDISSRITVKGLIEQLACEKLDVDSSSLMVTSKIQPSDQQSLVEEIPLTKVPCNSNSCEQHAVSDVGRAYEETTLAVGETSGLEKPSPISTKVLDGSEFKAAARAALTIARGEPDGSSIGQDEVTSARDVAEKLIQAWRTGQLGASLTPTTATRGCSIGQITPNPPKRRIKTSERLHATDKSCNAGQTDSVLNRPRQTSTTTVSKPDSSDAPPPPPQSPVAQIQKSAAGVDFLKLTEVGNLSAYPKENWSPSKPQMNTIPVQSRPEVFLKNTPRTDTKLRVEEIVPEARSLDFILGSLSAQVKELDDRLRSVTSYTDHQSSTANLNQSENAMPSLGLAKMTSATSPGKTSSGEDTTNLNLKQGDVAGEYPEVKSPRAAQASSSRTRPFHRDGVNQVSGNKDSAEESNQLTAADDIISYNGSGPKPKLIYPGQSPMSSIAVCLENLADLVQGMNVSSAAENLAHRTLYKPSNEYSRKTGENGGRYEGKYAATETSVGAERFKKFSEISGNPAEQIKQAADLPSRVLNKTAADFCRGETEPTGFLTDKNLDGKESCRQGGSMHSGSGGDALPVLIQQPKQQATNRPLPHSSIDLAEAMSLYEMEEQLLSGSVDFSPWSTENLPDVFSSATKLERNTNHTSNCCEATPWEMADVDCEGTLRPVYCHIKRESEWLLRGPKLRRKSKAYEKRKVGRVKGKQKRGVKKPFNPLALPPRRFTPRKLSSSLRGPPAMAAVLPKVSTTRIKPSSPLPGAGALKFQQKEPKAGHDGSAKLNLTSRSLPTQFPASVTAEEVQKWLCRDAARCPTAGAEGHHSRESVASLRHLARFTGNKRPDALEPAAAVGGHQAKLLAHVPVRIPELGLKKTICRETIAQHPEESRRRPASAGTVLKC